MDDVLVFLAFQYLSCVLLMETKINPAKFDLDALTDIILAMDT